MGVKSDSFKDDALTNFEQSGNDNIESRVGFKASATLDYTKHSAKPFIETNWIHNTKRFGVKMNGVKNTIAGTNNIGELKFGVEGKFNDNLDFWTNVSQQIGQNRYSELQGNIGIKAVF
ncbi:TPA: autotransporter outer membrane beta-barrel domain-containing protein [Escherichia coli]|nr:autotransporter outer membrane beta-barrel domain-containing protein [Escherichia coli]HCQ3786794.1 autotransporter outer membrane beta-barrel domain-containing protein [Escherichia coli]